MNTVKIERAGQEKEYSMPGNWEECSRAQLLRIWDTYNQKDGTVGLFQRIHLIFFLMATPNNGEPKKSVKQIKNTLKELEAVFDAMCPPDASEEEKEHNETYRGTLILELFQCMDFMKEQLTLHTSRAPWFLGWRGFSTQLNGMTIEQFALANLKLSEFLKQPETPEQEAQRSKALNELVAVLYRPFFMPWLNKYKLIELYAWLAKKLLPQYIKRRMMMFWKGHLDYMLSCFPELSREKEGDPDPYGWEGTFEGLSGPKFGTYASVKKSPVIPVLIHLEKHARQVREAEENLQNNTP